MNWPTVWGDKSVHIKFEIVNKTIKDGRESSVYEDDCETVHLLCGPLKGPKPQILPFRIWTG